MAVSVKQVDAQELREVRFKVLWPHLGSIEEAVIDIDGSDGAIHLAAFDAEANVVGVASLFLQDCERFPSEFIGLNVYRLRAMGVVVEGQGMGVGAAIISKAEEICRADDTDLIWCDAREVSWGFYSKIGFEFGGTIDGYECEAYDVKNIGLHKMMYKRI
jgi:GNAT superfamily N-acetyltransferase